MERGKERERRKCNTLTSIVEEQNSETTSDTVLLVFSNKLGVYLTPVTAQRIGKANTSGPRLILVHMKYFEEKLLKQGKKLSGTGKFLSEDLTKEERKKTLVTEMKKAKSEGKKHLSDTLMAN